MKVFHRIAELREYLKDLRSNHSIGLVPTMGMLHQGHLALVNASKKATDLTVATIFVNPLQFNNKTDLEKYPRDSERDLALLQEAKCDVVFLPDASEIYPKKSSTGFSFAHLESVMEGAFRPGHFSGMAVIVSKLFNIVQPDYAFFGQKDLQQFAIINQFVDDLNFPIKLVRHPIVREHNGLALSSRNVRLSEQDRHIAPELFKTLKLVSDALEEGGIPIAKERGLEYLGNFPNIRLEYLEIVDANSLEVITSLDDVREVALCIAAYLGEVRLIDNVVINLNETR